MDDDAAEGSRLLKLAHEVFDEVTISDIYTRAGLAAMKVHGQPIPGHPHGMRCTSAAFQDALLVELRRRLAVH